MSDDGEVSAHRSYHTGNGKFYVLWRGQTAYLPNGQIGRLRLRGSLQW